jgi:predicted phage terminase large subunit-like protein
LSRLAQAIVDAAKKELARQSLADFALYTDSRYIANWHHRLLCEHLDRFAAGTLRRLMVFMPPRHGKSELVSRKLPAFLFGRNPDAAIIASSYSADLAQRMNRDVQRIIDSPKYGEIFPNTSLNGKNIRTLAGGSYLRNSDIFEIVRHRGTYRGAGVGGGITGMGGDYIIIDDPIKNREEANSLTYRDKLWDWYTSTLYTRQEKDAAILLTLTRWHALPAFVDEEQRHPGDKRKDNEALWSDKYSHGELMKFKSTIGIYEWSAQYQQRPQPAGGTIFKREWMNKTYRELPAGATLIQSWDLPFKASESSAKCAGIVMARKGAEIFFVDVTNGKMAFTDSITAIKSLTAKHPRARAKIVEDKANGPAIISYLQKDIPGMIPFNPKGSKEDRALSVAPYFEAGNVYFPESAPWKGDLIDELLRFPTGVYKDQVDASVQGILYLMDMARGAAIGEPSDALAKNSYWRK